MFETMAVQNLRKLTDWLFKVKCWHGVILNLAQNGLWPAATNNFKDEQIVASYWPKTSWCLVCPYLYLCIWGLVCICVFVCVSVSGCIVFIFVSGCLVLSGSYAPLCLWLYLSLCLGFFSLSLCLVVLSGPDVSLYLCVWSLSLCPGVLSGADAPLWAVTEWIEATVRLPAWHPLLVTDRDALVTDTTFHTFFSDNPSTLKMFYI